MEFTKVLQCRRSTRAYRKEQITEEQLSAILAAAQAAPIGMGRYDRMRLVVVQDEELLENLNADFASAIDNADAYPTYGAPTVIFVLEHKEDPDLLSGANAACVVEHMALAATNLGLGSVYLLGICRELQGRAHAAALLQIPSDYRMISAVAVGIPQEPLTERPSEAKMLVKRL